MRFDSPSGSLTEIGGYEILATLGSGGQGTVYKARVPDSSQIVALKVLATDIEDDLVQLKRSQLEFLVGTTLQHPNLVSCLGFGCAERTFFLVMEFVEGENLAKRVATRGPLPLAEALSILSQIGEGVTLTHTHGFIHRDIKPHNVLVSKDGLAKLTDFGIVKELDSDCAILRPGEVLGSPHFMAPEQLSDSNRVGSAADIYSLAATLYFAVTGELPFDARSVLGILRKKLQEDLVPPRTYVPDLDSNIERVILGALRARPGDRPFSCTEFIHQLHGEVPVRIPTPSGPSRRFREDRREFPRYRTKCLARWRRVESSTTVWSEIVLVDISAGGIGIFANEAWSIGEEVEIELSSPENAWDKTILSAKLSRLEPLAHRQVLRVGCRWLSTLSPDLLGAIRGAWYSPVKNEDSSFG